MPMPTFSPSDSVDRIMLLVWLAAMSVASLRFTLYLSAGWRKRWWCRFRKHRQATNILVERYTVTRYMHGFRILVTGKFKCQKCGTVWTGSVSKLNPYNNIEDERQKHD